MLLLQQEAQVASAKHDALNRYNFAFDVEENHTPYRIHKTMERDHQQRLDEQAEC
jgi:hypothetical protein